MRARRSTRPTWPAASRKASPRRGPRSKAVGRAPSWSSWCKPPGHWASDMSDILERIVAVKREEVAAAKKKKSIEAVREDALSRVLTRDFEGALRGKIAAGQAAVIAE